MLTAITWFSWVLIKNLNLYICIHPSLPPCVCLYLILFSTQCIRSQVATRQVENSLLHVSLCRPWSISLPLSTHLWLFAFLYPSIHPWMHTGIHVCIHPYVPSHSSSFSLTSTLPPLLPLPLPPFSSSPPLPLVYDNLFDIFHHVSFRIWRTPMKEWVLIFWDIYRGVLLIISD